MFENERKDHLLEKAASNLTECKSKCINLHLLFDSYNFFSIYFFHFPFFFSFFFCPGTFYFFPSRFSSLVHCSFIDGVVAIDYGCGINMFHPNGTSPSFCTDKAFRNHFFLLHLFASTSLRVWKKGTVTLQRYEEEKNLLEKREKNLDDYLPFLGLIFQLIIFLFTGTSYLDFQSYFLFQSSILFEQLLLATTFELVAYFSCHKDPSTVF